MPQLPSPLREDRVRGVGALALLGVAVARRRRRPNERTEDPRCHGRQAKIVGTDGDDVLHGTPERDVIWGGEGDDTIHGSLGNDLLCGGPGADLVHGGRGNDVVDGGAGDDDRVDRRPRRRQGASAAPATPTRSPAASASTRSAAGPATSTSSTATTATTAWTAAPASGDIASFATDVGAGRGGGGVKVSLATHRARGDGHDRLFRFEDLEGSAFDDILVGNKPGQRDRRRRRRRHDPRRRRPRRARRRPGTRRLPRAPRAAPSPVGGKKPSKASAYVELDPTPGGGGGLRSSAAAGPTTSSSPSTKRPRPSASPPRRGSRSAPAAAVPSAVQVELPDRRAGALADGRPRPGPRQPSRSKAR